MKICQILVCSMKKSSVNAGDWKLSPTPIMILLK